MSTDVSLSFSVYVCLCVFVRVTSVCPTGTTEVPIDLETLLAKFPLLSFLVSSSFLFLSIFYAFFPPIAVTARGVVFSEYPPARC